MFGSDILDVAIGIAFVFALVSTICSAIREAIESLLKTRAAYLEHGIRQLLGGAEAGDLMQKLYNHPLVSALFPGKYTDAQAKSGEAAERHLKASSKDLPSYIPSRNFALAIMDIAAKGGLDSIAAAQAAPTSIQTIRANLTGLGGESLQRALLAHVDAAQGDTLRLQANLEAWFDGAMERVSGWYKRATQWFLFWIALVLTVAMNINTITIADYLFRHDTERKVIVAGIEKTSPDPATQKLSYDEAKAKLDSLHLPIGWTGVDAASSWGAPRTRGERAGDLAREKAAADQARGGTGSPETPVRLPDPEIWDDYAAPIIGWLLTAIAAMLGAPFWFDLLGRLTHIRSTMKPAEKPPVVAPPAAPVAAPTASARALTNAADDDHCGVGEHSTATPDDRLPAAHGGVAR
jgi:hypothetical protein